MQTKEKIKVFISSKSGGEHVNFNQSIKNTSINKKTLADKALRSNYDLVRRALKKVLEETNIIDVYVFEDSMGTTQTAEEDYEHGIDDSDVCLFLIDNFDSVLSGGLLKEIDRADENNKKSIYLFLNDTNFNPTQIQQNFTNSSGHHYYVINDVRDFIDKGYQSIIDNIITIYHHYCRGRLISKEVNNQTDLIEKRALDEISIVDENTSINIIVPEESIYKKLSLTIKKVESIANDFPLYEGETSALDEITLSVLNLLLGEANFDDIHIDSLFKELQKIQHPDLHQFVVKRWKAISKFYAGEIDKAIADLEKMFDEYLSNKDFPGWLVTDLLIDLHNFYFTKEQSITVNYYSIQKKINDQKSFYHYPILDKFSENIFDDIWDRNFKLATNSSFSINFINYQMLYRNIANYLFTAIYYGSYSKIRSTLEQIWKILFDIVGKDDNLLHKNQLMRISILVNDGAKFNRIMGVYRSSLSHDTSDEIFSLYKLADTKITLDQKKYWKIIIFREIGYYFSDDNYNNITKEITAIVNEWIENDVLNIKLGNAIIEAIKHNIERLSPLHIINFAFKLIDKNCVRFYNDLFEMLYLMKPSSLSEDSLGKLLIKIESILINDQINNENLGLEKFLLKIRKSGKGNPQKIDDLVGKYYPKFFNETYNLEILSDNRILFIEKYLNDIQERNKTQGKGGKSYLYGLDLFLTIKNIIKNDQIQFNEQLLLGIIRTIKDTLFLNTQTFSEKISALHLLMVLRNQTLSFDYDWNETFTELEKNYEKISQVRYDYLSNHTLQTFNIYWIVLKISFGEECSKELLENLAVINNQEDFEKIQSLVALIILFRVKGIKLSELKELSIFVQYISSFCFSPNPDIRHHTVIALYLLIDTKYGLFAIDQLVKMMDDENYEIKLSILEQVPMIEKQNKIAYNYIMSKAKINNHFLIRRKADSYTK